MKSLIYLHEGPTPRVADVIRRV